METRPKTVSLVTGALVKVMVCLVVYIRPRVCFRSSCRKTYESGMARIYKLESR